MEEHVMIHKANQIALFFASYPREEAIEGVRNHFKLFWVPRMRAQIIDYVAQNGGEGLHELAIEAVKRLEPVTIR
jgi:formate dehydrogenase subunit delta